MKFLPWFLGKMEIGVWNFSAAAWGQDENSPEN